MICFRGHNLIGSRILTPKGASVKICRKIKKWTFPTSGSIIAPESVICSFSSENTLHLDSGKELDMEKAYPYLWAVVVVVIDLIALFAGLFLPLTIKKYTYAQALNIAGLTGIICSAVVVIVGFLVIIQIYFLMP
jgi:hypothetical protein